VSCEATPDRLEAVHEAMAELWQKLPETPGDEWRMLFELAVSEVAANIVEHARPKVMQLRLRASAGVVTAEFADGGQGWSGPPEPAHVLDELAERGRGLSMAIAAVDDVVYERAGSVNRWRLVKRL
jgi:serine/threonine-protein kinase RsbW